MIFDPPLEKTQLLKRYKRFLADVVHPELGSMTVHCPNTGSMKNCWEKGWQAWVQKSANTKRKYPFTWVISENNEGEMIGINTHLANKIVVEGIEASQVSEFQSVEAVKTEVKYGNENSRIDILLEHTDNQKTFVEVKSVTLKESNDQGYFPDAETSRGQKHIRELIEQVKQGHNAVLFFLVQHSGIKKVSIAKHIDPTYAQLAKQAITQGVQILVYSTKITRKEIVLDQRLPFSLN